ncbi:MAG: N-substituted formamide deformylase [Kerstersia gyiorum]|uniref:amidohydrolase n=1 Tax=Kerstersia gyiorum TaxID=206506 RepID=UPI0030E35C84
MIFHRPALALALAAGLSVLSTPTLAASGNNADMLLHNGRIYTENPQQPWVEAIAIKDGNILALGKDVDLLPLRSAQTEVVDLQGKMAMPGIVEAHSHPVWGGLKQLFQCNFPFTVTPEALADIIQAYVARDDTAWIRGGQWDSSFFKTHNIESPRRWLDAVSGDKAITLTDDTGHNAWVNSKALALLKIDANFQPPSGMSIGREADGKTPNGVLYEGNNYLRAFVPDWSEKQYLAAADYAIQQSNRYGITGIKDADASEAVVKAYHALDTQKGLNANVATAIRISGQAHKHLFDPAEIIRISQTYATPRLKTNYLKIYVDGVPTSVHTAAMLNPYADADAHDPHALGMLVVPEDELKRVVLEFDKAGYGLKMHTAGDRAIRLALDAIEAARQANGKPGTMHELAHAEFISAQDLPRFGSLNAAADFSPYIWYPSPLIDAIRKSVGDRADQMFPARTLLDQHATIIAGSDWPSGVKDNNPWPAIEALLTRADPHGQRAGQTLNKEQAIKLEEALRIFTQAGAKAIGREEQTGTLEVGKSASRPTSSCWTAISSLSRRPTSAIPKSC